MMENQKGFGWPDYMVLVLVMLFSGAVGAYHAIKSRLSANRTITSTKEFLVGQVTSPSALALSMVASIMSAINMLGIPAETYTHSCQFWAMAGAVALSAVLADKIFLPMFYELRLTSVYEYLQRRTNSSALRIMTSSSYVIGNLLYLGTTLYGPALALNAVTPVNVDFSIIVVGVISTIYTAIGGMRAVVWTDVFQVSVMYIGLLMVVIQGTIAAGGWNNIWDLAYQGNRIQLFVFHKDVSTGVPTVWEIFLGMTALWTALLSTNQYCVQRYCCVSSLKKARIVLYATVPGAVILVTTAIYCGLALFAVFNDCDPIRNGAISRADQLMPYFVVQFLSHLPGLAGLFVAAIFSGSLSTISSVLNAMTTVTWEDLFKRRMNISPSKQMIVVKVLCVLFGMIVVGLAFLAKRFGSILQAHVALNGSIKGPILGVFLLSALWPSVRKSGLICGLLTGQIGCLVLNFLKIFYSKPPGSLPTSVSGCEGNLSLSTSTAVPKTSSDYWWIDSVSMFLVPFVGVCITLGVAIVTTYVTGTTDVEVPDDKYLSPLIQERKEIMAVTRESFSASEGEKNCLLMKTGSSPKDLKMTAV